MPKGSAAIGSVLPRENSNVDSVPCNKFTMSKGLDSLAGSEGAFPFFASADSASVSCGKTALMAASPDDLRKVRLFVWILVSRDMCAKMSPLFNASAAKRLRLQTPDNGEGFSASPARLDLAFATSVVTRYVTRSEFQFAAVWQCLENASEAYVCPDDIDQDRGPGH